MPYERDDGMRSINNGIKLKASSAVKSTPVSLFNIIESILKAKRFCSQSPSHRNPQRRWRRKWMKLCCQYHISIAAFRPCRRDSAECRLTISRTPHVFKVKARMTSETWTLHKGLTWRVLKIPVSIDTIWCDVIFLSCIKQLFLN